MTIIVSSCVGTVKTADPSATKTVTTSDSVVQNFDGIQQAVAVSHNKVELFFYPILKDIDKYSYVITYDRQTNPIYISANSLSPDYRGFVKYTVHNLEPNTTYNFAIQVRDISSGKTSSNSSRISAKTFNNVTCNFEGISEVRNLVGADGLHGIEVFWPEAEITGGMSSTPESVPGDPDLYVITVLNSNYRSPSDMNNDTLPTNQRTVVSLSAWGRRSIVINGLDADTKYYVQVRCSQKGVNVGSNSSNLNYKKEENSNYLEIKTYSQNKASLSFAADKFALSWPPNNAGLFALNTSWEKPTGNFDHYRIYYKKRSGMSLATFFNTRHQDSLCYDVESDSDQGVDPVYCQNVSVNDTSAIISGLDPNTEYSAILQVCITTTCTTSDDRVSSMVQYKYTSPNIASFDGLKQIIPSNDLNELNSVFLEFNAPNYNSGTVSGFLVDYYPTCTSQPITLNDGSISQPPLIVDDFDYRVSCPTSGSKCRMKVKGIDISTTNNFCFSVYPFSYNSNGDVVPAPYKANLTKIAGSASLLKAPNSIEFTGFTNKDCRKDLGPGKVALFWNKPLSTTLGIYEKYEIYYVANQNFSFINAHQEFDNSDPTNYGRIVVDQNITSINILNLDPTKKYTFGINTYYSSLTQILRSTDNAGTVSCDFPAMP